MKKKKMKIIPVYGTFAGILVLCSLVFIGMYLKENIDYKIEYVEKSDLDYKVYLKENNYFTDKYLGKDSKYIANLIDYISADYKYDLDFPTEAINYNYSYKIMAELSVKDKDDDVTYYEHKDLLYTSGTQSNKGNITIDKNIKIDYNKYNELIKGFVKDFDLDKSDSTLKVAMYVTLLDSDNEYLSEINNNKVISLNIPLTTKTVSIDLNSDLQNSKGNYITVKVNGEKREFLVVGSILLTGASIMILFLVIYYFNSRTPLALYKKKLKSILSNYSPYIQEISSSHKIGASMVYKLKSFDDLLEVRDCLQKPILMVHNTKNTGTFFIIPANEYTIYSYALRVVDIIANKHGVETPEYDVTNLNKETLAEQKFTKQYIDAQIDDATRTITMHKLDADNVIMGNKNSKEKLYEQLEKTTSYKLSDIKAAAKKAEKKEKAAPKVVEIKAKKVKEEPKKVVKTSVKEEKPKVKRTLKKPDKIIKDLVKSAKKETVKVTKLKEEEKPKVKRKLKTPEKIVKDLIKPNKTSKKEEKPKTVKKVVIKEKAKVTKPKEDEKPKVKRKLKSPEKIVKDLVKPTKTVKKETTKIKEVKTSKKATVKKSDEKSVKFKPVTLTKAKKETKTTRAKKK